MRKITLLAFAFFMVASPSFAQIKYGIKAGLNFSSLTNMNNLDQELELELEFKTKTSFYMGVMAEYRFSDFLGISPELVYSRQGVMTKNNGETGYGRINYLNLPVMAKLYLTDDLSLDAGPQLGLRLNGKDVYKVDGSKQKDDVTSQYKTVDVNFAMGLTYNFGKIFAQVRYNLGLTDTSTSGSVKHKNNVIQIGAGYCF